MEKQLFDWDHWDVVDHLILMFYDCTLRQDIGRFKNGSKLACIILDYNGAKLELCPVKGLVGELFNLELKVATE